MVSTFQQYIIYPVYKKGKQTHEITLIGAIFDHFYGNINESNICGNVNTLSTFLALIMHNIRPSV